MLLLEHLLRGCSLSSASLVGALLDLGLEIHWGSCDPAHNHLSRALAARLHEAAESGLFAAPDAPFGTKAGQVVHCVFLMNCESPLR
jgi:hypothetical protein